MTTQTRRGSPVAIVGLAAQLPSGRHSDQNLDRHTFWQFLLDKKEAYEKLPQERLEQLSGDIIAAGGTFLKGTTKFDNVEFGASTKDAASMTASTRRMIELGFLAMLDSGIDSRGKKIGTFIAGTNAEHFEGDDMGSRGFGTAANTLANRVAYTLNVTGPSLYLDTACSSTLTAMHLAIRSLESGDCDAAIVGGCQHNMNFWDWMSYTDGGILTRDNKCKPFDVNADGFVKGEGAGTVVIKPLEDAVRDNDHIYAVILGSAINSNGARAPLHAPSGVAQQECIRSAYAQAGRDPKEVDFVELHATGTAVGDPIEANAAGELFARDDEVIIGSVKGNLGHLEISAFFTSLLKICLVLENKVIPPNVHLSTPNPKIMWDKYGLKVPTEALPLGCRSGTGKSLVSLASSGIGGSNGHVVLESGPQVDPPALLLSTDTPVLFIVGGLSPRATQEITNSVVELLTKDRSKEALSQAVTHARRARQLPWRSYFICNPGSPMPPQIEGPILIPKIRPPVVFVFTGQGPQHIGMGRHLFSAYPVFRASILDMDEIYKTVTGVSLIESTGLFDDRYPATLPAVWSVDITIPAMTIMQIALFDLVVSVGVKPDILVGHSAGETPMIYASGAGSKAMAVEISIARGRAMKLTEPLGAGMAAVACGVGRAAVLIEQVKREEEGVLDIACHNSPDAVVVSGSSHLVDKAIALAQDEGMFARKVQTLNPAHTSLMDACRSEYEAGMKDIFHRHSGAHKPTLPCYSTVSGHGRFIDEFTSEYCWSNVRQPVHFHQSISSILQDHPTAVFMEVSPHPTLSSYIVSLGVPSNMVTCPMRRPSKKASSLHLDLIAFAESLGVMSTLGINNIDLTSLYGRASRDPAFEIPYPFTTRQFPLRFDGPRELPTAVNGSTCSLRVKMNTKLFPDLAEHVINGEPIVPAAGFIDMVLQTGAKILWDLEFKSILSLSSEIPVEARVEHDGRKWELKTLHKNPDASKPKVARIHSSGFSSSNSPGEPAVLNIQEILARMSPIDSDDFYESLKPMIEFGPLFQRLASLSGDETEAVAEIRTQTEDDSSKNYVFHPVILDACLHWALHPALVQNTEANTIFLPSKLRKFTFYGSPKPNEIVYSHFLLREWTPESRVADMTVCTRDGVVLCRMQELELKKVSSGRRAPKIRYDLHLQPLLTQGPLPRCEANWAREEQEVFDTTNTILDHLAVEIMKKSLEGDVVVGNTLDRRRYFEFAQAAVERVLPPLPEAAVVAQIKSSWPLFFEITDRLAAVHKSIFTSSAPVVQALYSDSLMTDYYDVNNGFFGPSCKRATRIFDDAITSLYLQGKRVIRILEVGAGTGLLTRHLCNVLKERKEVDLIVEYVVSDISLALASNAAMSTSYEYSIPKMFDLTQSPEAQGILPGSFDIVTGLHVLHAVPEIVPTLSRIHKLLVGGGSLLIVELNGDAWKLGRPGALWEDFVFGGFAEWFGFTDGRDHCLMSPETWTSLLLTEGYEDVQTSVEKDSGMEFIFTAQRPSAVTVGDSHLEQPSPVFLNYKFGEEMLLQQEISILDVNQPITLWLLAKDGVDGDAGVGLSQSLVWEYSAWEVHLAIFEDIDLEQERIDTILRLGVLLQHDTVIRFLKGGIPYVPKVIPSPPPPLAVAKNLDVSDIWVNTGSSVTTVQPAPLRDHHLSVNVTAISSSISSWRGFVGSVVESDNRSIQPGSIVIGVAETPITNRVVCHSGQVALLPQELQDDRLAEYALAILVAALVLGPSRLSDQGSAIPALRLLIATKDDVSRPLCDFLALLPSYAQVHTGTAADDARFDLIVTDTSTTVARPEVSFWRGKIFLWDEIVREKSEIDPWLIGFSLKSALRLANPIHFSEKPILSYPQIESPQSLSLASRPLFSDRKSYILIGGASDLGVQIALWMYQNGARHVVLTSRRGKAFFDSNELVPTKQRLAYLEGREDLSLRVEACDATSLEATSDLVQNLRQPLGGCFLMTLVLADQLFMHQTEESFRKVCDAKMKALETFGKATAIDKLDFFIFFSSTVAVLGNFGQTNYAAANNAVEGELAKHPNAFSIAIPGLTNVGYLARVQGSASGHYDPYKKFDRWSAGVEDLCVWIEDGLLKMWRGERLPRYIPDFPWQVIDQDLGLSKSTRHLVIRRESDATDKAQEKSTILNTVLALLDVSMEDWSPDIPFTAFGLDSLGATRISEAIRPFASVSQMQLLGGMTWTELEERINFADSGKEDETEESSTAAMLEMVAKYSQSFGIHRPSAHATSGDVVVVTGTTGSIGASVLCELVKSPEVHRIYAVNRRAANGSSLMERQKHALDSRGLDPSFADSPKLILLEADLELPDLGLRSKLLNEIRTSATHIIHISWTVNWTTGLKDFEPNVSGLRHLIDLALSSPLPEPPRLVFVSSVSAIHRHAENTEPMPERFSEPELAVFRGYSESKWVAERLLETVASETPLQPLVLRVGQVCGGVNGMWNTNEWIPGIVQSARNVRCLPSMDSRVSWLPLDVTGSAIFEARNSTTPLLQIAHPRPVPWNLLFNRIASAVDVPMVPWSQWLSKLEDELQVDQEPSCSKSEATSALLLLDLWRQIPLHTDPEAEAVAPRMSTKLAVQEIPSLAAAPQLSVEDVDKWLFYWRSVGFLSF